MKTITKTWRHAGLALIAASTLLHSSLAQASDDYYEVTVTNLTQGVIFTPVIAATHKRGVSLFELGSPASSALEQLAEGGDTAPLSNDLTASGKTLDMATADGVLLPGASLSMTLKTDRRHPFVSLAAMLVPTNDAFFSVNSLRGPRGEHALTVYSPAYDAGTENNDEACAHIPGPPFACTGEGYSPEPGEGFVHIHPGIHGIGDLSAASYDWRNPVAKITIRRIDN